MEKSMMPRAATASVFALVSGVGGICAPSGFACLWGAQWLRIGARDTDDDPCGDQGNVCRFVPRVTSLPRAKRHAPGARGQSDLSSAEDFEVSEDVPKEHEHQNRAQTAATELLRAPACRDTSK
jgi:hypothetical protein